MLVLYILSKKLSGCVQEEISMITISNKYDLVFSSKQFQQLKMSGNSLFIYLVIHQITKLFLPIWLGESCK